MEKVKIERESDLEDWLENSSVALVQDELILWIGRQTGAAVGGKIIFPDLLGVDSEGNLVVMELKKDEAPRKVVGQLLDYASWANELPKEEIYEIAQKYFEDRDGCQDVTFETAFKDRFDLSENDELPPLKGKLRLFIVAQEIEDPLLRICQFLRTTYSVDIGCVEVSKFQTKSGDEIVNMETIVGKEDIINPPPIDGENPPTRREIVRETVQEFTGGNTNRIFAPREIRRIILKRYPDFNRRTVPFLIISDAVNSPAYDVVPVTERKYWKVERGQYRLYAPENDQVEG